MTQQAIVILNRWIAETVQAVPPEEVAKEAARLATEFTAYAEDAGLQIEEIEVDLGQDLSSYMKEALLALANADGLLAEEE